MAPKINAQFTFTQIKLYLTIKLLFKCKLGTFLTSVLVDVETTFHSVGKYGYAYGQGRQKESKCPEARPKKIN